MYDNESEEELSETKEDKNLDFCHINTESDSETENDQELSVNIEDIEKMEEINQKRKRMCNK